MKFYKINTYGCQMNVHESEKLAGMLLELGYVETNEDEIADIILFNTCCIRENAEQRVFGNIGALKPIKKKKKDLIIAVGGCMSQQDGVAKTIQEKFPFVDIVFGTHNLCDFKELLLRKIQTKKRVIEIKEGDLSICEKITPFRTSFPNAWVNVMYGCNNFCTYCIVPYVRGREKSRTPESIVSEVESLVKQGYKEITLLGQNVDSYGKTADFKCDFADLLSMIDKIDGKFRIRFMSNHPKDITKKVCDVIASSNKICKCVHLPLQSGSDRILSLMNRRYTSKDYLEKVKLLKDACQDIAITTDIMVGFPTETVEDFLDSLKIVNQVMYDGAFTFVYSRRKGTKADQMQGHIDEETKKSRIMRLVDRQNEINRLKSQDYLGKIVEVLVEDFDEKKNLILGRDDKGRMLYFAGDKSLIGTFVQVKVLEAGGISLIGEICG